MRGAGAGDAGRRGARAATPTAHPDVFAAARIGLGALGVVTAVTLQAVPAFALRAVEGPGTLTAALEGFEELMTSTDHVEFYWFPHTDATLLKCNTRVPLEEGLAPLPRWRAVWDDEILANAAFAGVVAAGRRVPGAGPAAGPHVGAGRSAARTWTDHSHRVFVSRRRVRFLEMEYAVPRADAAARPRRAAPGARGERLAGGLPGRGAGGRRRRHPAVDGVRPGHRLHRRARARGHRPGALVRGAGVDRRRGRRAAALGQAARPRRRRRCGRGIRGSTSSSPLRDRLDPTGVLANAYLDRVLGPAPGR